jgi:uncharacterized membrane protein
MIHREKMIQSTIIAFFAMTASHVAIAASDPTPSTEKCYGIAKAGMNDCQTATASCASSSTQDSQADAFLLMPSGLCERVVGGHLKPDLKQSG